MIDVMAKTTGRSRAAVKDFIIQKLYPTDTPDFNIGVITVFSFDGSWWVYLDTTLPDDMIYVVKWPISGGGFEITPYKKVTL